MEDAFGHKKTSGFYDRGGTSAGGGGKKLKSRETHRCAEGPERSSETRDARSEQGDASEEKRATAGPLRGRANFQVPSAKPRWCGEVPISKSQVPKNSREKTQDFKTQDARPEGQPASAPHRALLTILHPRSAVPSVFSVYSVVPSSVASSKEQETAGLRAEHRSLSAKACAGENGSGTLPQRTAAGRPSHVLELRATESPNLRSPITDHRSPKHRPPKHRPPKHRPPKHRPPKHRPPNHRPPKHRILVVQDVSYIVQDVPYIVQDVSYIVQDAFYIVQDVSYIVQNGSYIV